MSEKRDKLSFYLAILTCNVVAGGMFTVMNMPPIDVPGQAAYAAPVVQTRPTVSHVATMGKPTRIVLPSIESDIDVSEGDFDVTSQSWTISDDKAYHASMSEPANDSNGTTLLYGHNRDSVFGKLDDLAPGDIVEIYTDTNKKFTYTYSSVRDVLPQDVSVFTDVGPPTLVLQTCTGLWDRYRALYTFTFTEVS